MRWHTKSAGVGDHTDLTAAAVDVLCFWHDPANFHQDVRALLTGGGQNHLITRDTSDSPGSGNRGSLSRCATSWLGPVPSAAVWAFVCTRPGGRCFWLPAGNTWLRFGSGACGWTSPADHEWPACRSSALCPRVDWRPGDVALLCTKTQDSVGVLDQLPAPDTPVVCLQNGVANERSTAERFTQRLGVCMQMPGEHLEPGRVAAFAEPVPGVLNIGRLPRGPADRAARRGPGGGGVPVTARPRDHAVEVLEAAGQPG